MRRYTDIETMIKQANGNRDMIFLLNDNTVAQNIAATSKKEFLREHNVVNVPRKKQDGKIERLLIIFEKGAMEIKDVDYKVIYDGLLYGDDFVVIKEESNSGKTLTEVEKPKRPAVAEEIDE